MLNILQGQQPFSTDKKTLSLLNLAHCAKTTVRVCMPSSQARVSPRELDFFSPKTMVAGKDP
jgi:hypothetical protein